MSIEMMSRVWKSTDYKATELLILLALADFSDDKGNSFPSLKTLAEKSRCGHSHLCDTIAKFERDGILKRERRFDKSGRQTSTFYTLFPEGAVRPPDRGVSDREDRGVSSAEDNHYVEPSQGTVTTEKYKDTLPPTVASDVEEAFRIQPMRVPAREGEENEYAMAKKKAAMGMPTLFSSDYRPSKRDMAHMKGLYPALDLEEATARFIDYHSSITGSRSWSRDWNGAWRFWIRTEAARQSKPSRTPLRTQRQEARARNEDTIARWKEETDAAIEAAFAGGDTDGPEGCENAGDVLEQARPRIAGRHHEE